MSTQNKNSLKTRLIIAAKHLVVWGINVVGIAGIFLIIYAFVAEYYQDSWKLLDRFAENVSKYFTLIGVVLTASSIYFPVNTRKPDEFSKLVSAPIVILFAMITMVISIFNIYPIPRNIINGFALLAISGSLFRLISR